LWVALPLWVVAQSPFRGTLAYEARGANDVASAYTGRWVTDGSAHLLTSEMLMQGQPVNITLLAPIDREGTFLLDYAAKQALTLVPAAGAPAPTKPTIEWTEEWREILGYRCRKLLLTTPKGVKKQCWVHTALTVDFSRLLVAGGERSELAQAGVNGLLFEELTLSEGGSYVVTFRLTLVQESRPDAGLLQLPLGFTVLRPEDLDPPTVR
jgi:hypothetical protein